MKLEPNMYVRTNDGYINKIKKVNQYNVLVDARDLFGEELNIPNNEIIKSSSNIIDLIKPKDIILGNDGKLYQCWKVYKDYVFTYSKNKQGLTITLVDYQIDRVMCYEQFESMSYKVGD